MTKCLNLEYDVVLSFAGEDRSYVEATAKFLRQSGVRVFYDKYEDVDLWGKDLYQHLDEVYQRKAKYAVVFISEHYKRKLWTNHELRSAQSRAFSENEEYILPVRFDDTEIPGIRQTVGYISLTGLRPISLGKKILKKLGNIEPENFLPDNIAFVKQAMHDIYEDIAEDEIETCVSHVFNILRKLSDIERKFISVMGVYSCRHDIELDFHEDITLLERVLSLSRSEILKIARGLSNLGIQYSIYKDNSRTGIHQTRIKTEYLSINLVNRSHDIEWDNLTIFLHLMIIGAIYGQCEYCAVKTIERLDFTSLSSEVSTDDLNEILSRVGFGNTELASENPSKD